jgi:formamidopyrimidine-DNA glycosylase
MPELPEVETTRQDLHQLILGQGIVAVDCSGKAMRLPWPADMAARLVGRRLVDTGRRAKYLLLYSDDDQVLAIHLGMSGRMLLSQAAEEEQVAPHSHLRLTLTNGTVVSLQDPRRFGSVSLMPVAALASWPPLSKLGVEPFSTDFTADYLAQRLAGRVTAIKTALLDQQLVAGIGNIYASEALHLACIAPQQAAGQLTLPQLRALVPAIQQVLTAAIASGGSSLRDHIRPLGQLGGFQNHFRVYDRMNQPCPNHAGAQNCSSLIKKLVQTGRATFYCPSCQALP